MEQKWIKTEEMLENLRSEPGVEQQYERYLGPMLRSTHWLKYDGEKDLFGDSTDWVEFGWFSSEEFLKVIGDGWWRREH